MQTPTPAWRRPPAATSPSSTSARRPPNRPTPRASASNRDLRPERHRLHRTDRQIHGQRQTKKEEPTGIKPGDTVTFNAASSELPGGFRKELIWKFGDGTEKVNREPSEEEEAVATVTHVYSSAAKVTPKLEIRLAIPRYGHPVPVERTFTVGTPASKFKLKVVKAGTGTGGVTALPAGIDCGSTCEAEFAKGTEVTLTATARRRLELHGWSGGGCSGTGTCNVTMQRRQGDGDLSFALETLR